ncbi:MAG: hypothetical protein ACO24R_07750, partial [Ilumatobacteraceae bacterium]
MTYAGNRRVIDIDAHILEPAQWLGSFVDAAHRDQIPEMTAGDSEFERLLQEAETDFARRAADPA